MSKNNEKGVSGRMTKELGYTGTNFACSLKTQVQDATTHRAVWVEYQRGLLASLLFSLTPPPPSRHGGVTRTLLETRPSVGMLVEARTLRVRKVHINLGVLDTSIIR